MYFVRVVLLFICVSFCDEILFAGLNQSDSQERVKVNKSATQLDIASGRKRVKIDYFALSKCPYYIELEEEIVQISGDLDDLYDLNLHLVGLVDPSKSLGFYCVHGESECYGNFASLCAIHLSNNRRAVWLRFTQCQNEDYRSIPARQDACAVLAGFDVEEFHRCIADTAPALFLADLDLADAYNVTGSPTVFVNDKRKEPSTAADFNKLICDASARHYPLPAVCRATNTRIAAGIVVGSVVGTAALVAAAVVVVAVVLRVRRNSRRKRAVCGSGSADGDASRPLEEEAQSLSAPLTEPGEERRGAYWLRSDEA